MTHNQPQRLVRSVLASPSAGRLTSMDGLGAVNPFGEYGGAGTDEQAAAEGDTDWVGLVAGLVKVGIENGDDYVRAFAQKKSGEGLSSSEISSMLGLAQQRATAVQSGLASMPTGTLIGIGIAVAAVIAFALFARGGRR